MILSDKKIRTLCEKTETPLIENFSEESLQSESYDISIGKTIAIIGSNTHGLDLKVAKDFERIYQKIELTSSGYQIQPQEFILVSVQEKLNMPDNLTAHIRPRTRFTRAGLLVCAQHINSTYSGNLWIGLYNATNYPITIYIGIAIAQFVFEELEEIPSPAKQYKNKMGTFQKEKEGDLQGSVITEKENQEIENYVNRILMRGDDGRKTTKSN